MQMAPAGANWHPIESAPNEGAFLVTDGSYIAEVFNKRRGTGFPTTVDGYIFEGATHWMPNPAFPSDAGDVDG